MIYKVLKIFHLEYVSKSYYVVWARPKKSHVRLQPKYTYVHV